MSQRRALIGIPQWAEKTGLADDGRSIATARTLIAKGSGPQVTTIERRTKHGSVAIDGVHLGDHEQWAQANAWAQYLTSLAPGERAWRATLALRMVGHAAYVTRLYQRYCQSQWRFQMTFEQWLKRRQRLRDKDRGRQQRRAERHKGGR